MSTHPTVRKMVRVKSVVYGRQLVRTVNGRTTTYQLASEVTLLNGRKFRVNSHIAPWEFDGQSGHGFARVA